MRVRVFLAITTFLAISLACNDSPKKVRSEKTLAPKAPLQITFLSYSDSLFLLKKEDGYTGFGYGILSEFAATYKLKLNVRMCATEAEVYERMRKGEGDLCITRRMVYETANSNFHHSTAIVSRVDTTFFKSNFGSSDLIYSNSSFYRNQIGLNIVDSLHHSSRKKKPVMKTNACFSIAKKEIMLKHMLDSFLNVYLKSDAYIKLQRHWFEERKLLKLFRFKIPPMKNGMISPYDPLFKKVAQAYGWDWRLLAAVCFKESRFNPNALGNGGAFGMMQFMPRTGRSYGVHRQSPPEVQVAAGMKLLHKMNLGWSGIPDIEQRTKFTLASYNAGNGHILDAQRLAVKHGYNPMIWDGHVQLMVANLSSPTYYNDPLVKSGAYRGHADSYANIVYQIYQSWKE